MPISILCLGDLVGKPGRVVLAELLPDFIRERGVDFVVANAENAAGGSGLTPPIFEKILCAGVDVCTLGDHAFRKREVLGILDHERLVRPANFPPGTPGKGLTIVSAGPRDPAALPQRGPVKIANLNVMGRLHMNPQMDDPFRAVDELLAQVPTEVKIRILDFHAEVSSEKVAMGWYVAGRVSICFGTHTHVPTADARILRLDNGPATTAFVSDLGMCGPYDSILGRRKDRILKFMTTGLPQFFEVATADPRLSGIVVSVDEVGGHALTIERIDLAGTEQAAAYDPDDPKPRPMGY